MTHIERGAELVVAHIINSRHMIAKEQTKPLSPFSVHPRVYIRGCKNHDILKDKWRGNRKKQEETGGNRRKSNLEP